MQGKVVLITGGAKRVGAAICRRLHTAGANLMLHYRASAGEARLLQAELNHARAKSVALIQADLLDTAKLPSLVEQTVQTFGRLDGLVNNASSFFPTPVGEITVEGWHDLIGTNLRPRCFSPRPPRPRCARRKAPSSISPTSTPSGRSRTMSCTRSPRPGWSGLTRTLARELAPDVRVNAVAPGPVLWPDDESFDELSRQRIISHTPLKREGTPDDIAVAVYFLLADAHYVTGRRSTSTAAATSHLTTS